jgi:hypothetical protein
LCTAVAAGARLLHDKPSYMLLHWALLPLLLLLLLLLLGPTAVHRSSQHCCSAPSRPLSTTTLQKRTSMVRIGSAMTGPFPAAAAAA